jgi:hypothetical protein
MMRSHSLHLPFAILLSTLLAGCAGLHAPKSPENRNIAAEEKIAADTVNQLARIYSPAKTQFNLVLVYPHGFGMMLADKLRIRGYAVSDRAEAKKSFYPDAFAATFQPKPGPGGGQESALAKTGAAGAAAATGIELRYTLDDARLDHLLRISLKVGGAYLARAYLADNSDVAAAGAWTYRGE